MNRGGRCRDESRDGDHGGRYNSRDGRGCQNCGVSRAVGHGWCAADDCDLLGRELRLVQSRLGNDRSSSDWAYGRSDGDNIRFDDS